MIMKMSGCRLSLLKKNTVSVILSRQMTAMTTAATTNTMLLTSSLRPSSSMALALLGSSSSLPHSTTCQTNTFSGSVFHCRYYSSSSSLPSSSSPSSIVDYFGSLRVKAAEALTSTLPEDEKTELLERMGAVGVPDNRDTDDDDDDDATKDGDPDKYQHTIDEAVAAAKAREAERYEERWEMEKDKLKAEAEDAARRRVESDLDIQRRQIAFEKWKRDLEAEREQQQQHDTGDAAPTSPSKTTPTAALDHQSKEEALGAHPILGTCLADLGHKRVHTVSARALSAIPVWKKQRIFRHGRAKAMAKDKLKTLHLGLPGVIGLYEGKDGSLSVIDGQHRIGMLKSMEESAASGGFDFDNILVEVYPENDESKIVDHAKEIFLEINKAEPVKLVDTPGIAKASDLKVINEGANRLHDRYPEMFKESQKCRVPHVNIDIVRDALFASGVLQRHSIKTPKALEEWMLAQNDMMSVKYQSEENRKLVPAKALAKAEKFDFYLGLDSSWYYS